MQRVLLQRFVLAFVLALGGLAVVSSLDSCRRTDILDPIDTSHTRDTSNHRDTTIVRDTSNTRDTTVIRDTNFVDDSDMVINGGFDQNPGTFMAIPPPWEQWTPFTGNRIIGASWSQLNGCGSGHGSMMLYTDDHIGVMQEMRSPFRHSHTYQVSLCANVTPADSATTTGSAKIDIMTSQDNGLTMTLLTTIYTNSMGWASYSKVFTSPLDSKNIYVVVNSAPSSNYPFWVGIDNVKVTAQ
jgi:hypothetical protein